jgi:glutathione S-transferase
MKLYWLEGGAPSLACRMTLEYLKIPYERIAVDYNRGELFTDWYTKVSKTFKNASST